MESDIHLYKDIISIHALRGEGDLWQVQQYPQQWHFNPRPPWGGRQRAAQTVRASSINFNPRPPWGGRLYLLKSPPKDKHFNPRPPWGGRRYPVSPRILSRYFNPRPPWGGRQSQQLPRAGKAVISIHALRGEGDPRADKRAKSRKGFQSTPSVGRATIPAEAAFLRYSTFQSTPSVGRATWFLPYLSPLSHISIHALRGEGDWSARIFAPKRRISIHALRGEGDKHRPFRQRRHRTFQSTPSVGRATQLPLIAVVNSIISIHALRGEGDAYFKRLLQVNQNFNPRPPWGGRPTRPPPPNFATRYFNPRPPWGGRPSLTAISR